jgi:hypothetical protein
MLDDIPDSEKLSRALRLTTEAGPREQRFQDAFPDVSDSEMMTLLDISETILQSAEDLGIAIADRRIRQRDFEPRMTQQYPFLTDEDITLLLDAALKSAQ